jgi:hypothetical protein
LKRGSTPRRQEAKRLCERESVGAVGHIKWRFAPKVENPARSAIRLFDLAIALPGLAERLGVLASWRETLFDCGAAIICLAV